MSQRNLTDVIAELHQHAVEHESPYAYRFMFHQDLAEDDRVPSSGDLVEVRAFRDGSYKVSAVDRAGRPLEQDVPAQPDDQPFIRVGVTQPRRTIREEIREEEASRLQAVYEQRIEERAREIERKQAEAEKHLEERVDTVAEAVLPIVPEKHKGRVRRILLGE